MTKKIQEISLSFFFIVCGISLLLLTYRLRPVIESHRLLINETRANQQRVMKDVKDAEAILKELGYGAVVIGMWKKGLLNFREADRMLNESIARIEGYSPRLGKLLKLMSESRRGRGGGPR